MSRIKLTDLQFNLLVAAQARLDQITKELSSASSYLKDISSLIGEAVGVSPNKISTIDATTKELIVDD